MNASESVLEMRQVVKRYKEKRVLDGLSLSVPRGSVVGLLGKNGAGKTTLIKCALGLIRPQEGQIRVLGEPAWELSAVAKARLGYVPQVIQLFPWMRVGQMLAYTAAFYPHWNARLIERLMAEWELRPQDRIGPLSIGQLQKVAILLALGHEPEFLVLDEPAASLDPVARREFLRALLDIASDTQRTVLFSTHITSDLERVADRVAILKEGRILYCGELDALKDQVKRLHVTARGALPGTLELPEAGILRQRIAGHEALLSVRHLTPAAVDQIQTRWQASVEVEDLNLEDIFLELHDEA